MSATGRVLRIERSSSYDGEGLRTVVFLKGCPLSCLWCSTPESQKYSYEIGCDGAKCRHCGLCIKTCPCEALSFDENKLPRDINNRCNGCGKCQERCPADALSLYGQDMTAQEVVKEIEKDAVFYFHSGGGFTFSGGEALAQPKFMAEIFRLASDRGISGTIETSVAVPWANIEMVLPWLSKLYIDIKHMDPKRHKELTGATNELILDNIKKIDSCGKQIVIRVPVIPSINDSEENIKATAEFCSQLRNIDGIELLSFHKLGMITYKKLGREMALQHLMPPPSEKMQQLAKIIKSISPSFSVKINGGEF